MKEFIRNFAKIKATKIAKENSLDYSNIKKGTSTSSKVEELYKEIRKRIFTILLLENLSEEEKESIKNLERFLLNVNKNNSAVITIDYNDVRDFYKIYKIFEEFLNE